MPVVVERTQEMVMVQPGAGATILVVEDDVATSEFFVDLLSWSGYHSAVVDSGQAALSALSAHPIQLVLLDRRLPDIDGLVLCRQLRAALGARVPILLLTADHEAGLGATAEEAGASAYLHKPINPDVLLAHIASLIG